MIPLNWRLRLSTDHFVLFMPLSQPTKRGVKVLDEAINSNYKEELDYYSTMEKRESMPSI